MRYIIWICSVLCIVGCSSGPKEINYGKDKCDFCTMTITDKPYAAEVITEKGKVYKFDSSECMFSYVDTNDRVSYAQYLTATMDKPAVLQDAQTSIFLVSPNLPSPMGANITAFSNRETAKNAQKEFSGEIYTFQDISKGIYKNRPGQSDSINHSDSPHMNHSHQ